MSQPAKHDETDPRSSGDPDTGIDTDDGYDDPDDSEFGYVNDPDGPSRNGAFDGRQVYSDAEGGL